MVPSLLNAQVNDVLRFGLVRISRLAILFVFISVCVCKSFTVVVPNDTTKHEKDIGVTGPEKSSFVSDTLFTIDTLMVIEKSTPLQITIEFRETGTTTDYRFGLKRVSEDDSVSIYKVDILSDTKSSSAEEDQQTRITLSDKSLLKLNKDKRTFAVLLEDDVENEWTGTYSKTQHGGENFSIYRGTIEMGARQFFYEARSPNYFIKDVILLVRQIVLRFAPEITIPKNLYRSDKRKIDSAIIKLRQRARNLNSAYIERYKLRELGAKNLADVDRWPGSGESDPFVKVLYNGEWILVTCHIDNEPNPNWPETYVIFDYTRGQPLEFRLFDDDIIERSNPNDAHIVTFKVDSLLPGLEKVEKSGQTFEFRVSPVDTNSHVFLGVCPEGHDPPFLTFLETGFRLCECVALAVLPFPITTAYDIIAEILSQKGSAKDFLEGTATGAVVEVVTKKVKSKKLKKTIPAIDAIICILNVMGEK